MQAQLKTYPNLDQAKSIPAKDIEAKKSESVAVQAKASAQVERQAEALHEAPVAEEKAVAKKPKKKSWFEEFLTNEFIRKKLPIIGYAMASGVHGFAGLANIPGFEFFTQPVQDFFDKNSLHVTKFVNSFVMAMLGMEAFKEGRMWDAFARLLDPVFVLPSKLQDMFLRRGPSTSFTMFHEAQKERVKPGLNRIDNIKANFTAFKDVFVEIVKGGIPGINKKSHLFKATQKGKEHTMALSGYMMLLGSLPGIIFGSGKRNAVNKASTIIRNTGGIVSDIGLLLDKRPTAKITAFLYVTNAIVDILQKFMDERLAKVVNHFNMILSNAAVYFYGKLTQEETDENHAKQDGSIDELKKKEQESTAAKLLDFSGEKAKLESGTKTGEEKQEAKAA